jgi:hypothetical protein
VVIYTLRVRELWVRFPAVRSENFGAGFGFVRREFDSPHPDRLSRKLLSSTCPVATRSVCFGILGTPNEVYTPDAKADLPAVALAKAGRSIVVVYLLWEQKVRVRFSAPRKKKEYTEYSIVAVYIHGVDAAPVRFRVLRQKERD